MAMLAKGKMEENKKIHSAVAEERRGEERRGGEEGERKEYEQEGTAFKALAADITGRVRPPVHVPIERPR